MRELSKPQDIEGKAIKTGAPIHVKVDRVNMDASPKFVFAFHPSRWEPFTELDDIFPSLLKIADQPGINGVPERGHLSQVQPHLKEKEGWYFINPIDLAQLPGYENGYCKAVRNHKNQTVHLAPYEKVRPGGSKVYTDWDEFAKLINYCLDKGFALMPTEEQLMDRRESLERKLAKEKSKNAPDDQIIKLQKKIKIIDRYLNPQPVSVSQPKPTPKTKVK